MRLIRRGLIAFVVLILVSHAAQAQFSLIQQSMDAAKGGLAQIDRVETAKAGLRRILESISFSK